MNVQQFYEKFLEGWSAAQSESPATLKRLVGKTLKWKAVTTAGALTFAFATNSKTAGLLPHLPGEFRLSITWDYKVDANRKKDIVSWFQYGTDEDAQSYAAQQRLVLEKFLAQPGKESLREIYNYSHDPAWIPRANFEEYAYYFDSADAQAWGQWYGSRITTWIEKFTASPEGFNDWCWRVLWSDSKPS